jgi:hypothetical protein
LSHVLQLQKYLLSVESIMSPKDSLVEGWVPRDQCSEVGHLKGIESQRL